MKTLAAMIAMLIVSIIGGDLVAKCRYERQSRKIARKHSRGRYVEYSTTQQVQTYSTYPNQVDNIGAATNDGWFCNGKRCYRVNVMSVNPAPKVEVIAPVPAPQPTEVIETPAPPKPSTDGDTPNSVNGIGEAINPWYPSIPVIDTQPSQPKFAVK